MGSRVWNRYPGTQLTPTTFICSNQSQIYSETGKKNHDASGTSTSER